MEEAMKNLNMEEALKIFAPNCDDGCVTNQNEFKLKSKNAYEMPMCHLCRAYFKNGHSGLHFYCSHMSGYRICGKCLEQTLHNYQRAIVTLQGKWTDGYQVLEINGNQVNSEVGKMELMPYYSKIFLIQQEREIMWKLYELIDYYNDRCSCVNVKTGRKIDFYRKQFDLLEDKQSEIRPGNHMLLKKGNADLLEDVSSEMEPGQQVILKKENTHFLNKELSKVRKEKENKHKSLLKEERSLSEIRKTNQDSLKEELSLLEMKERNQDVLKKNEKMKYEIKKLEKINFILFESNKKMHEKLGQINESNKTLEGKFSQISKIQSNNVQQIIRLNEENLSLYALNEMLKKENQTESLTLNTESHQNWDQIKKMNEKNLPLCKFNDRWITKNCENCDEINKLVVRENKNYPLCHSCHSRNISFMFPECYHFCICEVCVLKLEPKKNGKYICIVCCQENNKPIKVFFA